MLKDSSVSKQDVPILKQNKRGKTISVKNTDRRKKTKRGHSLLLQNVKIFWTRPRFELTNTRVPSYARLLHVLKINFAFWKFKLNKSEIILRLHFL